MALQGPYKAIIRAGLIRPSRPPISSRKRVFFALSGLIRPCGPSISSRVFGSEMAISLRKHVLFVLYGLTRPYTRCRYCSLTLSIRDGPILQPTLAQVLADDAAAAPDSGGKSRVVPPEYLVAIDKAVC
mgnify:CR=1 FL=1